MLMAVTRRNTNPAFRVGTIHNVQRQVVPDDKGRPERLGDSKTIQRKISQLLFGSPVELMAPTWFRDSMFKTSHSPVWLSCGIHQGTYLVARIGPCDPRGVLQRPLELLWLCRGASSRLIPLENLPPGHHC